MSCSTEDYENKEFESRFIKDICNSLKESFSKYKKHKFDTDDYILISKLENNDLDFNYNVLLLVEGIELNIDEINFPHDYEISSNIKYIIKNMYAVSWNNCTISFNVDEYIEASTFNECIFVEDFYLQIDVKNSNIRKYYESFIFFECTFEKNVTVGWKTIGRIDICKGLFLDCVFINNLKLLNASFKFPFFSNSENYSSTEYDKLCVYPIRYIENVIIENCVFNSNFTMNGLDLEKFIIEDSLLRLENSLRIKNISIKDSEFSKKFELKNVNVDNLNFSNSNVDGIFDVYKSLFAKAKFYKSIFNDFSGFEDVQFGSEKEKGNKEFLTIFKYVTFMDFSSFRGAKFSSGLDFSKTNLKDTPNFLDVDVGFKNTTRETFRIIKSSFDDVGNNIEANKFFSYEMRAYMIELSNKKGFFLEKVVLYSNFIISDFGRNYIRPLLILLCLLFIYVKSYIFYKVWYKSSIYTLPDILSDMSEELNAGAKGFLPFARFIEEKKGFEFISVLFYILFAILIWQIAVAIKRHTQR